MPIFNSINESLDEDELTLSQQRQLAILRKRREDRLIISPVSTTKQHQPSSSNNTNFRYSTTSLNTSPSIETASTTYSDPHNFLLLSSPSSNENTTARTSNTSEKSEKSTTIFDPRASFCYSSTSSVEYCYMDRQAVELLKNIEKTEIVEKYILPYLNVSDLLSLGLTSKNQLAISWTCLRIINEIHLRKFPNLMSNAMIEDQMDHVMAILMMKFSTTTTNTNAAASNQSEDEDSNNNYRNSYSRNSISSSSGDSKRNSWRLNDSVPLTSATLARRSIILNGSISETSLSSPRRRERKHLKFSSLDNSLISSSTNNNNSTTAATNNNNCSFSSTNNSTNNSSFSSQTHQTAEQMQNQSSSSLTGGNHMDGGSVHSMGSFQPIEFQNACGIEPLPQSNAAADMSQFTKLMTNVKRKTRRKIFRIVVVGEEHVGKTCFIESIFGNAMPINGISTRENDFSSSAGVYAPTEQLQTYCHPYYLLNGEKIDLVVHDTPHHPHKLPDHFKSSRNEKTMNEKLSENSKILRQAKKKVDLFLYCFDMTNGETLPSRENEYFKKFLEMRNSHFSKSTVALVGLKRDEVDHYLKERYKFKIGRRRTITVSDMNFVSYMQATERAQELNIFKAFLGCCDRKNMLNTLHIFDMGISLMYSSIMKKRFVSSNSNSSSSSHRKSMRIANEDEITSSSSMISYVGNVSSPRRGTVHSSSPYSNKERVSQTAPSPSTSFRARASISLGNLGRKVNKSFQGLFDKFNSNHHNSTTTNTSVQNNSTTTQSAQDQSHRNVPFEAYITNDTQSTRSHTSMTVSIAD